MTPLIAHQITCLYDMDIPRPENFNETYLYEGTLLANPLQRIALSDELQN